MRFPVALISLCLSALPRLNTCPNNCSDRGECRVGNSSDSVQCVCEDNWKGEGCDVPYCSSDCGFPLRGQCNSVAKHCQCKPGWQGKLSLRSSIGMTVSYWTIMLLTESSFMNIYDAFHDCILRVNLVTIITHCSHWPFINNIDRTFVKKYSSVMHVTIFDIYF